MNSPDGAFIRLRQNTLQLSAGMNGMAIRRSSKSEGGLASANSALIPRNLLRVASLQTLIREFSREKKKNVQHGVRPDQLRRLSELPVSRRC